MIAQKINFWTLLMICLIMTILFVLEIQYRSNTINTLPSLSMEMENNLKWPNDENNPVEQDDPALVEFVRNNFIFPGNSLPYNFDDPKILKNPSEGQLQAALPYIGNIKNGFFIELGANDGEWYSNTLYLERELGWSGLLIEASQETFKKLIKKNRKAWHSNAAVAVTPHPSLATFYENPAISILGGLTYRFYHFNSAETQVQCIPLYTLLLAINQPVIDFFSLDLEGSELDVLRTIPFNKVTIKVLAVEVINGKEGPEPVKELMRKNGYTLVATVPGLDDLVFVKSDLIKEMPERVR